MNAKTALKYVEEQGAKFVSVRFTDLPGAWHHLTFPIDQLSEDSFEDGFGFDASSLRGWASIHESDMLLIPDANRYWMEPFSEEPTLCLIANAVDPITKEGYPFDPRSVATRAESYLKFTMNFAGWLGKDSVRGRLKAMAGGVHAAKAEEIDCPLTMHSHSSRKNSLAGS